MIILTKAALYIRVSTQEQVENYSIDSQKERLEAFCKAKGWTVYETYIDGGYSGATTDRPALKKMIRDLNKVNVVVVYKLDRLSRSQRDTLSLIEEHFLTNSVEFVSITETLDTSTPFGKAMIGILSVFAQLERETIAERMRMGHIKRAENGLRGMGGDYDPAGYIRKDGHLIINENEAKHIKRLYDLYETYHSITKVQEKLKEEGFSVWRFRRYRDILANPLYVGKVTFAGKLYKGQHEPIIPSDQFERVQVLLNRHKGSNAHKAKESLLSGLIKCQCCGEAYLSYSTGSKQDPQKYYYYICRARRFPSEFDEKCMNKTWNRAKLEDLIIEEFKKLSIEKSHTHKKDKKINYEKLIKQIDIKMSRILDLYVNGTNVSRDLLEEQMNKYNLEKDNLIRKQQEDNEDNLILSEKMLSNVHSSFDSLEFKDKQVMINNFIKEIYINGNDVKIVWRF